MNKGKKSTARGKLNKVITGVERVIRPRIHILHCELERDVPAVGAGFMRINIFYFNGTNFTASDDV